MTLQEQIACLEELWELDQTFRMAIVNTGLTDPSSPEYRALVEKGMAQDVANRRNLDAFVAAYGWPRLAVHGEKACQGAFLVVQHCDDDPAYYARYLPLIRQRVQENEINPVEAAMMQDRYLVNTGQPQIYGSQAWRISRNEGPYVIWPVVDPDTINDRRKANGFTETVEEYAQSMGATYIPDLKTGDLVR